MGPKVVRHCAISKDNTQVIDTNSDITWCSAPTHGNNHIIVSESYTKLTETISEVSRALIDLGIMKYNVFNAYTQTKYIASLWSCQKN